MSKLIFITGVSSGLGRAIATTALQAGHTVVGTVRQEDQINAFELLRGGKAHARLLDVTDANAAGDVIAEVESTLGPIDVLINNAGYGVEGPFEETPLETFRRQFDVNVFGVVALTQAVLPYLRRRGQGHIIFVTSMGGLRVFPGLSAYHGSKYAVEGIAGTLRLEVEPLGIHVTSVEPGSFRTDWAGRSMDRVPTAIEDYNSVFGPIRARRTEMHGQQLGDPGKAGEAVLRLIDSENPPSHLILGSDALRLVAEARAAFDSETQQWNEVSRSTDIADGLQIPN